jgi:triosephosphate isomerase
MATKASRKLLIVGNWKMNFTTKEAKRLALKFKKLVKGIRGVEIVICPPFTSLEALHGLLSGSNVRLGAQNIFYEEEGTFTGEVSARMVAPYCRHVLLGHSERRKTFRETNQEVNKKIKQALKHRLVPIVCIGESLRERRAGKTKPVLKKALSECLKGLSRKQAARVVVSYEPIWAISKGKHYIAKSQAASPKTVQQAHAFVRANLSKLFGKRVSEKMRVLYGGSIKPSNVRKLMEQKDIDGGIVGSSSLTAGTFAKVVKFKE